MKNFDFIIVGAGSAGCVLASRLSEDPDCRVLVVEAGGRNRHRLMKMPLAFFQLFRVPALNWGYETEPEPYADDRRIPLPRGKVLGGSSSINGMMYTRGDPRDFDQWRQMGAAGWGYADVLPYFIRAEDSWRGASAYHGADGPLSVSPHRPDGIIYPTVSETLRQRGYNVLEDLEAGDVEGFGAPDLTIHKGHRGSTAKRYLEPILRRPNLRVEMRAMTTRVLLENGKATGIEYEQDGKRHRVHAEREVILCGGAYNSPHLLMLSGLGPADELRDAGVTPVHDLPGVGRRLQEHGSVGLRFNASGPVTFENQIRFDRIARSYLQWRLFGTGQIAGMPLTGIAFVKTRPELDRPDIEEMWVPTGMDARVWFPGIRKGIGQVISTSTIVLRPDSHGWVKLRSADPKDKPRIQLNLLKEASDRATFLRGIRLMREFMAMEPLASLVDREVLPGPDVTSDAGLEAHMRRTIATAHHPAGTCAMGVGSESVVDHELKVHGIEGLRVADASIMPVIVGGHTNAAAIMIGEKAADLIRGKQLAPAELSA